MKLSHYVIYITLNTKPRTSHAPWTNGLVEGMNRSLQEYLRCIINGNDTKIYRMVSRCKIISLSI